jgi:hypothetical protein
VKTLLRADSGFHREQDAVVRECEKKRALLRVWARPQQSPGARTIGAQLQEAKAVQQTLRPALRFKEFVSASTWVRTRDNPGEK